jgi:hypothetical protein
VTLRIHHELRNPTMGMREGEVLTLTLPEWASPRQFKITVTSVPDDERAIELEEL